MSRKILWGESFNLLVLLLTFIEFVCLSIIWPLLVVLGTTVILGVFLLRSEQKKCQLLETFEHELHQVRKKVAGASLFLPNHAFESLERKAGQLKKGEFKKLSLHLLEVEKILSLQVEEKLILSWLTTKDKQERNRLYLLMKRWERRGTDDFKVLQVG